MQLPEKFVIFGEMKQVISIINLIMALTCSAMPQMPVDSLHEADLLFVANPQGNAITSVTHGTHGLGIDHVGIVHRMAADGSLWVIEAVERGVTMIPIDSFRCEQTAAGAAQAVVVAGRVNTPHLNIHGSITRALRQLGKPYDHYYEANDSAIYCSELVTMCFVDSMGRQALGLTPMEFRDGSGNIPDHWVKLYSSRGLPVPEGAPGSNPGELSRRRQVTILGLIEW